MPTTPRPLKTAGTTQYQTEVAAGVLDIIDGEVDADLDTLYNLCNGHLDNANIATNAGIVYGKLALSGSIQGSDLAAGIALPAGTTLPAGSVGPAALADGSVTNSKIADGNITTNKIYDQQITRAKLAVNAVIGAGAFVANPTGFVLSTPGVWTTYAVLPSITTRGGFVHLAANPGTSVTAAANASACSARWLRDLTPVAQGSFLIVGPSLLIPLPGVNVFDTAAPAGAHTYVYQVLAGNACTIVSHTAADSGFQVQEIG
jgi:hypothetical protein